MEINISDKTKLVAVWLSKEEKQDTILLEKLKLLYEEYTAKKYLVAVFKSGERNLADATSDLICYNRQRLAQLEVQKARDGGIEIKY